MQVTELVQVIERVAGRYEVEDTEFGRSYKWHPGNVVIRCICGERLTLSSTATACGECGADHTSIVREVMAGQRRQEDSAVHPWRYWHTSEDTGLPL
ncbi:MAG: hypothetical protein M3248_06245 [Actinomycetota bacterium]|nr:hypothetical protein [Actinomycetota bacterium]